MSNQVSSVRNISAMVLCLLGAVLGFSIAYLIKQHGGSFYECLFGGVAAFSIVLAPVLMWHARQ